MDISTASQQDIAAALRSNGVNDPERWAQVVLDNQPYPPNDPSLSKLQQALARQHADPATIKRIVSQLAP